MKKKILVLGFALMMTASISACNAKGTASNDAASTQSQQAESKQDDGCEYMGKLVRTMGS